MQRKLLAQEYNMEMVQEAQRAHGDMVHLFHLLHLSSDTLYEKHKAEAEKAEEEAVE